MYAVCSSVTGWMDDPIRLVGWGQVTRSFTFVSGLLWTRAWTIRRDCPYARNRWVRVAYRVRLVSSSTIRGELCLRSLSHQLYIIRNCANTRSIFIRWLAKL